MAERCPDVVIVEYGDDGWRYTRHRLDGSVVNVGGPYRDQYQAQRIARIAEPDVVRTYVHRPPSGAPVRHDNGDLVRANRDGVPERGDVIEPGNGPLPAAGKFVPVKVRRVEV
jgi:hypothetical protein